MTITTSCANDFDNCAAGAANPNTAQNPFQHPPFRTTTVTYDPSVLSTPVSYGAGRFPTQTTKAISPSVNLTETTVYDPLLGKALSKTGPNGIQTCFTYDPLGHPTSETERCNSATPLVTTTQYFLVLPRICVDQPCTSGFSPPNSLVVTVTTPPTNAPSWSYTDDQQKSVGTLSYAFDGGLVETTTSYNALGQVTQVRQAIPPGDARGQSFAIVHTDVVRQFNRVKTVTDPLGVSDAVRSRRP